MPEQQALVEADASLGEVRQGQVYKGRFKALLIRAGWGSSGYYSEAVLRRDGPRIWPAGTRMHLDHQSMREVEERPEGSVRDWASEIVSTPAWDPDLKGLVAEIRVFPQWRELLNEEYAPKVGLSIRAFGKAEYGEAEGREGAIITSLDEGISVDWVTRAGAGGRVLQLIESARSHAGEHLRKAAEARVVPKSDTETEDERLSEVQKQVEQVRDGLAALMEGRNVGNWIESRIHRGFTELCDDMFGQGRLTREERISLSNAIGEGLTAFNAVVAEKVPHLYQRDIWDDPEPAPAEVSETKAPHIVPAPPATTLEESRMSGTNPQGAPEGGASTETEVTEAVTATARAAVAEAERDQYRASALALTEAQQAQARALAERDAAVAESRRLIANDAARRAVSRLIAESGLPGEIGVLVSPRVESAVLDRVPLNEAGQPNGLALDAAVTAAIEAERTYAARLLEAHGVGDVRGLGGSAETETLSESDFNAAMENVFTGVGLNADVAKAAAKGRVSF